MTTKLIETTKYLKGKGIINPEIGIVLGTGLGGLTKEIEVEKTINYADIPHFPLSTVESHSGKLIYGKLGNKKIIAMQGRFHYYEGYSLQQVTYPIRVMKLLGLKFLLLSNAAGAMNTEFKKASLMLITDHINLLPQNPLTGINLDDFGPRFPDMSKAYSPEINQIIESNANKLDIKLNKGIYVVVAGPNLETPALKKVELSEILEVAAKAEIQLIKLFKAVISEMVI
ncbi:MAG: purine-nucleoside phosphorylase [Bacteroidetes bacterium 4572_117]|nr:MAG: purine-nucleoside phosphorylase [Bacteroidetes bacterium 4572_117]